MVRQPAFEEATRGTNYEILPSFTRFIGSNVRRDRGTRVVDVGAGKGRLWKELPRIKPLVTLVDVIKNERDERIIGDAEALPLKNGVFSHAVSTFALEYVSDQNKALAEMHRVLKPGGKLVLLQHHPESDIVKETSKLHRTLEQSKELLELPPEKLDHDTVKAFEKKIGTVAKTSSVYELKKEDLVQVVDAIINHDQFGPRSTGDLTLLLSRMVAERNGPWSNKWLAKLRRVLLEETEIEMQVTKPLATDAVFQTPGQINKALEAAGFKKVRIKPLTDSVGLATFKAYAVTAEKPKAGGSFFGKLFKLRA